MTLHRLAITSYGTAAIAALRSAVGSAKAGDPLAPVSVAPPSAYAGLSLRRALAREAPVVNVRFLPLARISELLGASRLARAGRRPLVPEVMHAAVRAALASDPGALAEVAAHPSTERGLVATLRELRTAPADALDRLAARGDRTASVVRLAREVRARTETFYDSADLFVAAATAVDEGDPALSDLGTVVLHLPSSLAPGEVRLLEALAARGLLHAVFARTGEPEADEAQGAVEERLLALLGPPPGPAAEPEPPRADQVVLAPDPAEEVRLVLRDVVARLESGTALHRVSITYRSPEYARLVHDACLSAGIPHHLPALRTLGDTPPGRCLRGILELAGGDLPRADVMAWLTSAPVIERPGGPEARVPEWDRVSRIAGVVRGPGQWKGRLAGLERRLSLRIAEVGADPDVAEPEAVEERLASELHAARGLREFVAELARALRSVPDGESWAALGRWAVNLLVRFLGTETERSAWPETDAYAFDELAEALEGLAVLDDVDPAPRMADLHRAADELLARPTGRQGSFGDGVFVAPVAALEGTEFDVVFVLGMTEGRFPPRRLDDPLVPDREREAAGDVPMRGGRQGEERRRYLTALAAGRERVLLAPRADPRAQQATVPARWFLDAAGALAGHRMGVAELDALLLTKASDPLRRVPSIETGLVEAPAWASAQEHDMAALLSAERPPAADHPVLVARPALATAVAADTARRSGTPGPWTGFVGSPGPIVTGSGRPLSPTSLQDWATCPSRYFLKHVLRVTERDDPAELEEITALDRGSLVHEVLERFVAEHLGRPADAGWGPDDRARAREIAREVFAEYEERGRTGRDVLWRHRREQFLAELDRALDSDDEYRRREQAVPVAVEMPFGLHGAPPVEVHLGAGRAVHLRGSADRVDRTAGGMAVTDYKTGSRRAFEPLQRRGDPVDRGRLLQLPVYALAARQRFGDLPVAAHYWFVTDRGGYERIGYDLTTAREQRFLQVLGVLADGIEQGRFPARPGGDDWDWERRRDTWEHCRWCAFDSLCPADRADAWAVLRGAPGLEAYLELAEGAPVEIGGGDV